MKMPCREMGRGPWGLHAGGQQGKGLTPCDSLREDSAWICSESEVHPTGVRHTGNGPRPQFPGPLYTPGALASASAQSESFIFPWLFLGAGFKVTFQNYDG